MSSRFDYIVRLFLMLIDFVCINAALLIAFTIFNSFQDLHHDLKINLLIIVNLLWFFLCAFFKMYSYRSSGRLSHVKNATINSVSSFVILYILYLTISHQINSLAVISWYFLFQMVMSIAITRICLKILVRMHIRNSNDIRKIAIIGFNETGRKLAEYFTGQQTSYEFSGFFDDDMVKQQALNAAGFYSSNKQQIKGSVRDIINYSLKNGIREIYSTLLPDNNLAVRELVSVADQHSLKVRFVPDFSRALNSSYHINYLDQLPVITLRDEPLEEIRNQLSKRLFDIVFSGLVIVFFLSWFFPLIALLIKITSRGPVIFKQLRSGQDNKSFWCYKFRTMTVNNESDSKSASREDARVTWLGKIMRKTSIDELPQFVNVFLGDMSVVGPRPHMLAHTKQYSSLISKFMVRHYVKPGITGWAQVKGFRGTIEENKMMEKRVEYDIWYMEHWSLWMDIKIIFMTITNVFKGEEMAY